MANGVWFYLQDMLGPNVNARLTECVSKDLFNIYVGVGYPSPAQGVITFPELSGFVPNSEIGILITQSQVQQMLAACAAVDPRLKLWAWFGTWSSDNAGGDDGIGHQNARIDVDTLQRRTAVINACMTVARWGFYGIQDDTEDFRPASLEPNGQYGTTVVTFMNQFAAAAKAEGFKYHAYVPCVWFNFGSVFISQLTEPDALILAPQNDDPGQTTFNQLYTLHFQNAQRPIQYNFGQPYQHPWLFDRLEALPISGVINKIEGYVAYLFNAWTGNWGIWDTWRAKYPLVGGGNEGTPPWVWDGVKVPADMVVGAMQAAGAVPNGQKNAAYLQYIQGQIGSNYLRQLYRDGTKVWEASVTGTVPIANGRFELPVTATQTLIATADIDTGAWVHYVRNAGNSAKFIATAVTKPAAGAPASLSNDLVANTPVTLGSFTLNSPPLDTAPVGVVSSSDPRVRAWVDPNLPWASQPYPAAPGSVMVLQVSDIWNAAYIVQQVPEPGIIGSGSVGANPEYTLARVADPSNGAKTALLHRTKSTYPQWQSTARSSYAQGAPYMLDGTLYWITFAMRIDASWANGGNYMGLADVHHDNFSNGPFGRPSYFPWAPFSINAEGGLSYIIRVHGCYTPGGTHPANTVTTVLFQSGTVVAGDWHKFVIQLRVGRGWADQPSVVIWRKINNGALSQIASRFDVPISYYDVPANTHYLKPGMYQWDVPANDRTMYTKGVQMLLDAPGTPTLDATVLMQLLDSL